MSSWSYGDRLRAMDEGGRANATARRYAKVWAAIFAVGLAPRRWVTLEVAGRRSGRVVRFPLGLTDLNGQWYLVPMLGDKCNWVENVRAAGGRATLRHGRATACRLIEEPVGQRAAIIKRYLQQVPGARPHVPVDRRAPITDFEAIAPHYAVFRIAQEDGADRVGRKRHWWRWIAVGLVTLVLLIVLAAGVFIKLQPSAAPLALPPGPGRPAVGPLNGSWNVAAGSVAGFRVGESAVGFSNYVVGRTDGVSGAITVFRDRVTAATLRIDLATVTVSGKTEPQFATSLDTASYPVATFTLARPVTLAPAFASGATVMARATGYLTLRGVSRLVAFSLAGRRDGSALEAAGSIPIMFSAWGIKGPAGLGFLGSLADHGAAEFLIVLHRA
jgi:polyisoprenoid-binding protein YceI